jgi:putative glutamine transport system substrate-binding protein
VAGYLPGRSYLNPQTNKMEGFEPDLGRLIAKEIFGDENKIEFKKFLGEARVTAIIADEVDLVISQLTITKERLKKISFSNPYFIDKEALLVFKEGPIKCLSDLQGGKVAAVESSATLVSFQEHFPEVGIVIGKSMLDGIEDLKEHRVVAVINTHINLSLLIRILSNKDQFELLNIGDQFPVKEYGIGMKKDSLDLVRFINTALSKFETNGSLKKKLKEYRWCV